MSPFHRKKGGKGKNSEWVTARGRTILQSASDSQGLARVLLVRPFRLRMSQSERHPRTKEHQSKPTQFHSNPPSPLAGNVRGGFSYEETVIVNDSKSQVRIGCLTQTEPKVHWRNCPAGIGACLALVSWELDRAFLVARIAACGPGI